MTPQTTSTKPTCPSDRRYPNNSAGAGGHCSRATGTASPDRYVKSAASQPDLSAGSQPPTLHEQNLPEPAPGPRDLRVRVRAIAVNPVDMKVRTGSATQGPCILGWDAVGVVESVGHAVTLFKPGDEVFYAGSIARPGCYAEYSVVDERITGHKPHSLNSFA